MIARRSVGTPPQTGAPQGQPKRPTRTVIVVLVVIVVAAVAGLFAYSSFQAPPPNCNSTWECGASYPIQAGGTFGIAGAQCFANSTNVYCVGGVDPNGSPRSDVYQGLISASGNLSQWSPTTSYPTDISGQSCAAWGGQLYCVGGIHDDAGDDVATSYYTTLSASGTGPWSQTTPYPIPVDSESCVASNAYIYCIGGNNETSGSNSNVAPSDTVWFAPVNSDGIGAWAKSLSYPAGVYVPACVASGGYVYCIGGADPDGNPVATTYYAALSSTGVGAWKQTTSYLVSATGEACAAAGGDIYCVGGETSGGQTPAFSNSVYFAPISASGVGAWEQAVDYPRSVGTSCVISSGSIFCIGGFDESSVGEDNIVNYATLNSLSG